MTARVRLLSVFCAVTAMSPLGSARAQDLPGNGLEDLTLVIVASESGPHLQTNEFIVLKSSMTETSWTATASTGAPPKGGKTLVGARELRDLFNRIEDVRGRETPEGVSKTQRGAFYSLLLIEGGRVSASAALTTKQRDELGRDKIARSLFDSILRESVYAKANPMLELLLPADALRATPALKCADKVPRKD